MTQIFVMKEPGRFPLGELYLTAAVDRTIAPAVISRALARHAQGDWGDVGPEDWAENELSLKEGYRLLSAYKDSQGVTFWIITERDRSVTTVLLPDDY